MPIGAAGIGAGIGGITSLLGGILGSNAANKAAGLQWANAQRVAGNLQQATGSAQAGEAGALDAANGSVQTGTGVANSTIADAAKNGLQNLSDVYGQQTQNLNPYLQAGQQGIQMLMQGVGQGGNLAGQFNAPTAAEAEATPGYQFALQQGMKALQNSAAASGQLQGGGNLKAITQYAQGLADTNYQNTFNNSLQAFNTNRQANLQNIGALTGLGQFGTGQFNTAAAQYGQQANQNYLQSGFQQANNSLNSGLQQANNQFRASEYQGNVGLQGAQAVGNALTGGANAQAAGAVGSANAWNSALGGIGNAAQFYGLSSQLSPYGSYGPVQGAPAGASSYNPNMIPMSSYGASFNPAPYVPAYPTGSSYALPGGQY